tara:strand:- start:289 stop:915 length:627 start_codon:yes stop_codon:yes gene_type:complete
MQNLFEEACDHLSKDKIMSFLVKKFKKKINWGNRYNPNHAVSISNLIIEQQISFKAAITVKKRFSELINGMSNEQILKINLDKLQSIGISYKKAEYIKNVFNFFNNSNHNFKHMSDAQVIKLLSSIKGVGEWTSQMFLIFSLFRENIFSPKDLALINSIKKNYGIDNVENEMLDELVSRWSPYNSIACLFLWESIENKIFYSPKVEKF